MVTIEAKTETGNETWVYSTPPAEFLLIVRRKDKDQKPDGPEPEKPSELRELCYC